MRRNKRSILPNWLSFILSAAFVFSGVAVLIFAYLTLQVVFNRALNPLDGEVSAMELDMAQEGDVAVPTFEPGRPTPTLAPTNEPWQGKDRVTVLLMGIDRRPGQSFISRTDSIMLVSIVPEDKTVAILSIPRDLYVEIPGRNGRDRINTAFVYGSTGNNPAAGALLSMQTIERNLGIPINHYVLVDFSAVIKGIDALGGIDVDVPYEIYDPTFPDMNYGYDPFYVAPGLQHFDGEMTLKYARTRHSDNDFNRARRQQQVILAARQKALALGVTGLLSRAPALYQQVEQGIRTDLSLEQLVRLATVAADIPSENIRNEVIDYEYVSSYRTQQGASVLILDNAKAGPLIDSMFRE